MTAGDWIRDMKREGRTIAYRHEHLTTARGYGGPMWLYRAGCAVRECEIRETLEIG